MSHHEGEQILDVSIEAVRERFHTLNVPLAYFDGPAGTQVPDSVLEAVSGYLLSANANAGGTFATSVVTDDVIAAARAAASDLLGVRDDEVTFGANMTTLNFALSRTAARDWREGDEVVVTRLDHDANVAPWLELAYDRHLTVHFCELDRECRIDLDHLRSLLSDRTKVVAFPLASNAVGPAEVHGQVAVVGELEPRRDVRVVIEAGDDDLVALLPVARRGAREREVERGHVRPEGDLVGHHAEQVRGRCPCGRDHVVRHHRAVRWSSGGRSCRHSCP